MDIRVYVCVSVDKKTFDLMAKRHKFINNYCKAMTTDTKWLTNYGNDFSLDF